MAFAYTTKKTSVIGDVRIAMGTYTSDSSSTGGAIATGLNEIFYFNTSCEASQAATVNLVARSGGTATITTVADETGQWVAIGV